MDETRLELQKRLLAEAEDDLSYTLAQDNPDRATVRNLKNEISVRKAKVAKLERQQEK